jgi:hypothetical protein
VDLDLPLAVLILSESSKIHEDAGSEPEREVRTFVLIPPN